jgi:hypothetical protein
MKTIDAREEEQTVLLRVAPVAPAGSFLRSSWSAAWPWPQHYTQGHLRVAPRPGHAGRNKDLPGDRGTAARQAGQVHPHE